MDDQAFRECLDNQKLVSFSSAKELVNKEIGSASHDLGEARDSYERQKYKWSTIQAYYAMFHAARALINSQGYREKSHHCLAVALKVLFVDEGLMEPRVWRSFRDAKYLRESADYEEVFSEEDAKTITKSAESFIDEATSILSKKDSQLQQDSV